MPRPPRSALFSCWLLLVSLIAALPAGAGQAAAADTIPLSPTEREAIITPAQARANRTQDFVNGALVINYYPAHHGWALMWSHWDPAAIDRDMARIAALHATVVRLFLQPYALGYPALDPAARAHLAGLMAILRTHRLQAWLTLFDVWYDYGDWAGSVAWADDVLATVGRDPALGCVEIQNELVASSGQEAAWARMMARHIAAVAPGLPLTLSFGQAIDPASFGADVALFAGTPITFWSYHLYLADASPAALAALRAWLVAVKVIAAPRPVVAGESGFSTCLCTTVAPAEVPHTTAALEAYQARYFGALAAAAVAAGLPPVAPWILNDFAPTADPRANAEAYFGLYRFDGSPKPAVSAIRAAFARAAVAAALLRRQVALARARIAAQAAILRFLRLRLLTPLRGGARAAARAVTRQSGGAVKVVARVVRSELGRPAVWAAQRTTRSAARATRAPHPAIVASAARAGAAPPRKSAAARARRAEGPRASAGAHRKRARA